LVTGHAAAGKTTIAEKLAEELDALWISRDRIHEMVYSGWEPHHPALSSETYDPQVGESVFFRVRAASGEVHVKAKFSVNPARYTQPYHPVLPEDRVIKVIPTLNRTGGGNYESIRELNNTLAAEKCCNLNL
jgi:hypothetical protein